MNTNMEANKCNCHTKWKSYDGTIHHLSIEELLEFGTPICAEGIDMEPFDDNIYHWDGHSRYITFSFN